MKKTLQSPIMLQRILIFLFCLIIANRIIGIFQFYHRLNEVQNLYYWVAPPAILFGLIWLMILTLKGNNVAANILKITMVVLIIFKLTSLKIIAPQDTFDLLIIFSVVLMYACTILCLLLMSRKRD
jgi:hypothetical protein